MGALYLASLGKVHRCAMARMSGNFVACANQLAKLADLADKAGYACSGRKAKILQRLSVLSVGSQPPPSKTRSHVDQKLKVMG